jgi:hypothetical protein
MHWTVVTSSRGSRLVFCTHQECGYLDIFTDYPDALEYAKEHANDNN